MGFAEGGAIPLAREQFPGLIAISPRWSYPGWRIRGGGCSEQRIELWSDPRGSTSCGAIPIGRDVVIDVAAFETGGSAIRTSRRTWHVPTTPSTTETVAEQELDDKPAGPNWPRCCGESPKGANTDRGLCMNLDGVMEAATREIQLIIARARREVTGVRQ